MKSLKSQNYYDVLGVNRYATAEEIRSAYEISRHTFQENSLATYSLFSNQENVEILALIAKAFETLFNPESRRAYDAALSQQEGESPPPPRRVAASAGAPSAGAPYAHQPGLQSVAAQGSPVRMRPEADAPRRAPAGTPAAPAALTGSELARSPGGSASRPTGAPLSATVAAASPAPAALPSSPAPRPPAAATSSFPAPRPPAAATPPAAIPKPAPVNEGVAPNPARDEFIKTVTKFDGAMLKKLRLISGISLEEMAERSKIRRAYLEYIEEENFQFLPAPVYVKGFVTLMANILGAPAQRVAEDYMLVVRAKRPGS